MTVGASIPAGSGNAKRSPGCAPGAERRSPPGLPAADLSHVPTALMLHQSAELYGSDRVALRVCEGLKAAGFQVVALVPFDGPLVPSLRAAGAECHVGPVGKVARSDLTPVGVLIWSADLVKGLLAIRSALRGRRPDLVYSNTLAVIAGALWARLNGVKHVWHVHEILPRPPFIQRLYSTALRLLADKVLCNSTATRAWILGNQVALGDRTAVVWNGVDDLPQQPTGAGARIRAEIGCGAGETLVVLVGRINGWKGQEVLVEAADLLWASGKRNLRFAIVGDPPPGQSGHLDRLRKQVARSPASPAIRLLEFTDDPAAVWEACDVAVVPSTAPEPFGLVAVEAMAAGKPVVAAAHGGLLDIVEDGVTGLLVPPGDATALGGALNRLANDEGLRLRMGAAGRERQRRLFTADEQKQRIGLICRGMVQ
jgi:glycosyltransferase involved in cell wall biosynthesis